jgi:hypothetical protein
MDHLYGDGTAWNYEQYKDFLDKSNNIYNLHNTLFNLTNHIFDGEAELLQSWKNMSKIISQDLDNSENFIKEELNKSKVLEGSLDQYKILYKDYLTKIDKLLSENPEIQKAQDADKVKDIQEKSLNKLEERQKQEELLEKGNDIEIDETINKSLKITLQVFTGLIFILVIFLINSQTKILSSFSKSITKSLTNK